MSTAYAMTFLRNHQRQLNGSDMNKIMKNTFVLFVLLFLEMMTGEVAAQEPFQRSSKITKIGGKEYYMHTVKQGQTLSSISEVYNVTIGEIEKLNPEIKNGLKPGHVLGIPVRPLKAPEPQPEVVVAEPEPQPEPIVEAPEPEPEPIIEVPVLEPEPEPVAEPEPIVEEPEPEPVPEPELIVVEPEPIPEPEPELIVVEPEPVAIEPEPEPEPEPIVEESAPEQEQVAEDFRLFNKAFFDGKVRIVQQGETLYDIAKEYGIDLADLKAANVGLTNSPAVGTRIEIPAITNKNDYIIHECEFNERVTSLLKRWKVDEGDFRRINVSVGSHVFVNQVVLIPIQPIADFYWVVDDLVEIDEEETGEITEEDFESIQEEEELVAFDEGFGETELCFASPENATRPYKVALMVPLYLNELDNMEISKEGLDKAQKPRPLSFIQFYEGFMMAVESLEENEGLNMNLSVFDVTDNIASAQRALSQIRGEDYDLIVGPFFGKSFAVVEEYAKSHNIVMVNPLSTRESVIIDNPNVVKVKPGNMGQILTISNLVKNRFCDSNVFIVGMDNSADSTFLTSLEHRLNLALNDEGSTDNSVKRFSFNEIGKMKPMLSEGRNNLIVAYGDDKVFATQMLNSLAKETDQYPITILCGPNWAKFDKLLVDNLLRMNAIYLSDGFVDYSSDAVKNFVTEFRKKYVVEPQTYAFEGYDNAVFFLSALMRYGDEMMDCLNCCNVPLLCSKYRFINRNYLKDGSDNGRENQCWSLYQFDKEMINLKPVDPFEKKVEY